MPAVGYQGVYRPPHSDRSSTQENRNSNMTFAADRPASTRTVQASHALSQGPKSEKPTLNERFSKQLHLNEEVAQEAPEQGHHHSRRQVAAKVTEAVGNQTNRQENRIVTPRSNRSHDYAQIPKSQEHVHRSTNHQRPTYNGRGVSDPNLDGIEDDPRVDRKGNKHARTKGTGQNTESFDPKSTLVRPDMRIVVGPNRARLGKTISHDDVIVVPEFFCKEDDWDLYYQLVAEMRECQAAGTKNAEWISWAEGAHLISQNPEGSKTFHMVQDKIRRYFDIPNSTVGTRFNWYRDATDWKPFHHDSAAFNPKRAKNQNITVGVSFGRTRELAFLHAKTGAKIYFPQTNGMLFSFGRDVNILWKHGVCTLVRAYACLFVCVCARMCVCVCV
jgi:hypothetical protein